MERPTSDDDEIIAIPHTKANSVYSSSTLVTLAVVIAKSEIPRWRLEQGLLSLFFFPSSRGA